MPTYVRFLDSEDFSIVPRWIYFEITHQGHRLLLHRKLSLARTVNVAADTEKIRRGLFKVDEKNCAELDLYASVKTGEKAPDPNDPHDPLGRQVIEHFRVVLKLGEMHAFEPFPFDFPGLVLRLTLVRE